MNSVLLGQRIKEARISKKLTQAEVVGTFITRNMLSQIESGIATPSMKTLAFLAQALDMSLSDLLSDTQEDSDTCVPLSSGPDSVRESCDTIPSDEKSASDTSDAKDCLTIEIELTEIRTMYQERRFLALLEKLKELSPQDFLFDEKASYRARAAYEQALILEQEGDLSSALSYSQSAAADFDLGFYANPSRKAESFQLMSNLASKLSRQFG